MFQPQKLRGEKLELPDAVPEENWIPDNESKKCMRCYQRFNPVIRRRHHCRQCGLLICGNCSEKALLKGCAKPVRVCIHCLAQARIKATWAEERKREEKAGASKPAAEPSVEGIRRELSNNSLGKKTRSSVINTARRNKPGDEKPKNLSSTQAEDLTLDPDTEFDEYYDAQRLARRISTAEYEVEVRRRQSSMQRAAKRKPLLKGALKKPAPAEGGVLSPAVGSTSRGSASGLVPVDESSAPVE